MRIASLFFSAAAFALLATPALAQDWHHDHDGGGHYDHDGGPHWHGDIHSFHEHDWGYWRGGNWWHGPHGGRDGWWWTVNGGWYWYPQPVYPYPDPYIPPSITVQAAPQVLSAPPDYVYYCNNPSGYYPYVADCAGIWQKVPSSEPQPPMGGPPPAAYSPMAPYDGPVPPAGVPTPPPTPPMGQPYTGQPPMMAQPPMGAPPMTGISRDADDRELDSFGGEFARINIHGEHARTKLRALDKKVAAFREQLYTRPYNVMDILHDADRLEQRIQDQREKLAQPQ